MPKTNKTKHVYAKQASESVRIDQSLTSTGVRIRPYPSEFQRQDVRICPSGSSESVRIRPKKHQPTVRIRPGAPFREHRNSDAEAFGRIGLGYFGSEHV